MITIDQIKASDLVENFSRPGHVFRSMEVKGDRLFLVSQDANHPISEIQKPLETD